MYLDFPDLTLYLENKFLANKASDTLIVTNVWWAR